MIALSFYLASSIKTLNSIEKFSNGVFIIDDPVSSTSYNYFFGICNLLKYFDQRILKLIWDKKPEVLDNSKNQKIILTHNTQFFNVLRENVYKNKAAYYLITNSDIKPVPSKHLLSEFETALLNIKIAFKSEDNNITIGNDLRRFFETVKHFYGISDFNAETLKQIFPDFDDVKYLIFYNVVNYYSHGNPEAHTDPLIIEFEPFLEQFSILISNSNFKELWDRIDNSEN